MSDEEERKKRLNARKVKTLMSTLDNMSIFAAKFNIEVNNINQLHSRINELDSIKQTFQIVQDELELLENKDDEVRVTKRLLFQEKWFDVKAGLKELVQRVE